MKASGLNLASHPHETGKVSQIRASGCRVCHVCGFMHFRLEGSRFYVGQTFKPCLLLHHHGSLPTQNAGSLKVGNFRTPALDFLAHRSRNDFSGLRVLILDMTISQISVMCGCIYIYIYMYMYVYIYIYICMYVCMYVCMCIYIYIYVSTILYMHISIHIRMYAY